MYNVTITTTGIFDEIRPSLFPLVEGKEGITFINALEYSTDDILPFEEGDDITDNGPEIELEHERIRSFVSALCAEHGKPYNELRDEFVKALPEFMLDGTYKGEELLSTKRRGSYNVHALYKSERGRDLLFQRIYRDTNGLLYLSDHMVGYLIESLYGRSGIFGMAAGAQRITTPLRCYTIHQAINRVDRYYLPELIAVQALDNTYSMDESNRSEFLLIADALGAYMVQAMHGQTESEQLDTLSKDPFFRKVCEPVHRFYRNLTNDAIISVYDESNDWTDSLLHDYIYNLYDRFSEGIDYWEEGNEGVLGYVRHRILSPLADDLVRELSQEKLRIDLYPGFDKARAYFDFLVLLKSIHRFYLDQLDRNLWNELLRLWSMYGKRNFQDYYAECLCAKYMAVLAMYMGDRAVAERIKQDLHISFERASHWRELVPSDYSWSTFAFYTMAQIDEALGHLDSAQEYYDKAYVTHAYTQACWAYYESKCNSLWNGTQSSITETKLTAASSQPIVAVTKPDFESVIQENKGIFSTIDEYKAYFDVHMMYLYK